MLNVYTALHIATFRHRFHFPSKIIYSLNMCDLSNEEEMKSRSVGVGKNNVCEIVAFHSENMINFV